MNPHKVYSSKDKKITEDLYHFFTQHGEDDGWGERDKYGNFQRLIKISEYSNHLLQGSTVLDVGCGTGDMAAFLRGHDVGEYLGVDIVDLSIQLAKLKYPKEKFKTGDFLRLKFDKKYDFIFSSGTMAAVLASDNYTIMQSFIEKMWDLSKVGIAFNFLTKRDKNDDDDTLFLYDLDQVLKICKKTVPKAKIHYEINRAGDQLEFVQAHIYLNH